MCLYETQWPYKKRNKKKNVFFKEIHVHVFESDFINVDSSELIYFYAYIGTKWKQTKKYANGFNSVYIIDVQLRWKNLMEKEKWKNKRRRGKKCAFIFNLVQPKKKQTNIYI